MEMLFEILAKISPVPVGLREYLEATLKRLEVRKKTILLNPGQIAKHIYFIDRGLVRGFRHDEKREQTSWLMREKDFFFSVRSFLRQMPSYEAIETLENTILWALTYEELHYAFKTFIEFNIHRSVILENYYVLSEERHEMRTKPAFEKFKYLIDNHSELVGRVPDRYLASYLALDKSTFSIMKTKYWKGK